MPGCEGDSEEVDYMNVNIRVITCTINCSVNEAMVKIDFKQKVGKIIINKIKKNYSKIADSVTMVGRYLVSDNWDVVIVGGVLVNLRWLKGDAERKNLT